MLSICSGVEAEDGKVPSFYRFPNAETEPERRAKWISAMNRKEWTGPTQYSRVCSAHFVSGEWFS